MATIREILQSPVQKLAHYQLRKRAEKEYADDPTVEFHTEKPSDLNAPHGVNSPDEMEYTHHLAIPDEEDE